MKRSTNIALFIVLSFLMSSGCGVIQTSGPASPKPQIDEQKVTNTAIGYLDAQMGKQAKHSNTKVTQREVTNDKAEPCWLTVVTGTADGQHHWRVVMLEPHSQIVSWQVGDEINIKENGRPVIVELNMISGEPLNWVDCNLCQTLLKPRLQVRSIELVFGLDASLFPSWRFFALV